ncbi:OB-fold nucleic acid binding domain-containing protein [Candidatus Woesearchaeota archaeon]|nr:OB-fold nucleic acid binding domain-containing protein [Candidatus Woesearchaeota archaeon]
MDEKLLLKGALIGSIIGLIGLLVTGATSESIKDYENKEMLDYGSEMRAEGVIDSISSNGNMSFITLKRETELGIILFDSYPLPLEKGDRIEIRGTLDEYNGEDELIASEIRLISRQ